MGMIVTCALSELEDTEVKKIIQTGETPSFVYFTCYIQVMDRCIKIVSQSYQSLSPWSEAIGDFILVYSCNVMLQFHAKIGL